MVGSGYGEIAYNAIETAMVGSGYGEIAYNAIEIAIVGSPVLQVYTNIAEVAWILSPSFVPTPTPTPSPTALKPIIDGAPLVNSDYSFNNFGLRALSGQRIRTVDQVPFRLGVLNTGLAIRREMAAPVVSTDYLRVYATIAEVAWVLNE